jgi:hypothetical protein
VVTLLKLELNPNLATLGLTVSLLIYLFLQFTKEIITINYFTLYYPSIYLIVLYKILWYLSIFIFLQCSIIIVNNKYDEKESNKVFLIQVALILLSEGWAMLESFK